MSALVLPVVDLLHREAAKLLQNGDAALDATAGNGNDTLFLCRSVGREGHVYAFDIREEAISNTKRLLAENDIECEVSLIRAGHENMKKYVSTELRCAVFNLGYLPGGGHDITTKKETTLSAVSAAMDLLMPGGAVLIAIYWGHPEGETERYALEEFAASLPPSGWLVSETSFPNRNKAPLLMTIERKI